MPLTARGGGTSTAGNAVGPGHRARLLAPPEPRASRRPRRAHGHRRAGRDPRLDHRGGRAARPALRPRPVDARPRAPSAARSATTPAARGRWRYGRTADNVVALDVLTADGDRLHRRRGRARRLPAPARLRRRPRRLVDARPGARSAPSSAASRRQVSGYSLEHLLPENGVDLAKFLVGTEGTLGGDRSARPSGWSSRRRPSRWPCSATRTCRPRPTPCPALLPHAPVAARGHGRAAGRRRARAAAAPAAVPDLPRGGGWLFVETAGRRPRPRRVAAAEKLVADAGCLDSRRRHRRGRPRALWRIREDGAGLGGRTPAGAPAWPGWEDAAVPPEQLGAYLREFGALMREHRLDGAGLRALRRRLRARPHRLPARRRARRGSATSCRGRGQLVGRARRVDVRRARRRPGPRRAAAVHVLARGASTRSRAVKRDLRPGQPAQPRA